MTPPKQPDKTLPPALDFTALPRGQRRVAEALIQGKKAQTYKGVAKQLELSLGTVYEHLRRIRLNHPSGKKKRSGRSLSVTWGVSR